MDVDPEQSTDVGETDTEAAEPAGHLASKFVRLSLEIRCLGVSRAAASARDLAFRYLAWACVGVAAGGHDGRFCVVGVGVGRGPVWVGCRVVGVRDGRIGAIVIGCPQEG